MVDGPRTQTLIENSVRLKEFSWRPPRALRHAPPALGGDVDDAELGSEEDGESQASHEHRHETWLEQVCAARKRFFEYLSRETRC